MPPLAWADPGGRVVAWLLHPSAKNKKADGQMRTPYLLALRTVAVHAVLDGLVAGLAQCPAGHLHSQACLCAPLDGSLQPPAVPFRVGGAGEM